MEIYRCPMRRAHIKWDFHIIPNSAQSSHNGKTRCLSLGLWSIVEFIVRIIFHLYWESELVFDSFNHLTVNSIDWRNKFELLLSQQSTLTLDLIFDHSMCWDPMLKWNSEHGTQRMSTYLCLSHVHWLPFFFFHFVRRLNHTLRRGRIHIGASFWPWLSRCRIIFAHLFSAHILISAFVCTIQTACCEYYVCENGGNGKRACI